MAEPGSPASRLQYRLRLLETNQLSNATPPAQDLARSGLGIEARGSLAYVTPENHRYEFFGVYQKQWGLFENKGFSLQVSNLTSPENSGPIFAEHDTTGFAPRLIHPPLGPPDPKLRYELSGLIQEIRNTLPTIDVPNQNVLWGLSFLLLTDPVQLGINYRDSETVYFPSNSTNRETIASPWRRLDLHFATRLPLGLSNHHLLLGYAAHVDERGAMPRFPHGPVLDYSGRLGDLKLGARAWAVFVRNILEQDYEITYGLAPYLTFPEQHLVLGFSFGNENPYHIETRAQATATWMPAGLAFYFQPVFSGSVGYLRTTEQNILTAHLNLGFEYANFPSAVHPIEDLEPLEEPIPPLEPRDFLKGTYFIELMAGAMYYSALLTREPAENFSIPETPDVLDRLKNVSSEAEALENLINSARAEQGPIAFKGGKPNITALALAMSGHLFGNDEQTGQLSWRGEFMFNWLRKGGVGLAHFNAGLGYEHPLPIAATWALPLGVVAGGGVGIEFPDNHIFNWFVQAALVRKVWAGEDSRVGLDLFVRGGQFYRKTSFYYLPNFPHSPIVAEEGRHDLFVFAGLALGFGDRLSNPAPENETPPPVLEPKVQETEPPPREKIVWLSSPAPDPVIIRRIEEHLNGFVIRFKLDEPAPLVVVKGGQTTFDQSQQMRELKRLAFEKGPRFDPNNEEKVAEFLSKFSLEQFFFLEQMDLLVLIKLARYLHEFFKENPNKNIVIEGHASSEGATDHNGYLSQNRAELIRAYLILLGIEADHLEISAQGAHQLDFVEEKLPRSFEESGRAMNRRVTFTVKERG